jgi:SAM-dependent methyltransferase
METPITEGGAGAPEGTTAGALSDQPYLPGMSRSWLLPLYDPLVKLLRIGSHHRQLIDLAGLRPGERVLEIGCGTGNLALLIKRLHPSVEVVGMDPDHKALVRARRKATLRRLAVELDHGFAQRLPYPDASFDRVVSAFMFHHLAAEVKRGALVEAHRTLTPGGALHLVDFGGVVGRSDGLAARLQHRHKLMADNLGERIPQLMREAGFAEAAEIGHRKTHLGRVTHYRAMTSPE